MQTTDLRTRRYLATLLMVPALLLLALMIAILVVPDRLPAPRFSSNLAFNEKARWLRNTLPERCSTLIVGSSMAFNNIDAAILPASRFGNHVVNVSSWGMNTQDSLTMLKTVAPMCKPDNVILVTNYMDFYDSWEEGIDWQDFRDYIRHEPGLVAQLREFDLNYFITSIKAIRANRSRGKRSYQSMEMDSTGTVNLDCEHFQVDADRWAGPKQDRALAPNAGKVNLDAMREFAEYAQSIHARLLVLIPPLRNNLEHSLLTGERQALWDEVAHIVSSHGGTFVHVAGSPDYDDSLFVDYAHLNACGAKKFTRQALAIFPAEKDR